MRAAFNTTAAVFNGPGMVPPNVFRGNIPCRFVPMQKVLPLTGFWTILDGYVTYNSPLVTAGPSIVGGVSVGFNGTRSSRLLVASTGVTYMVYWIERITPFFGPVYLRAYVGPERP